MRLPALRALSLPGVDGLVELGLPNARTGAGLVDRQAMLLNRSAVHLDLHIVQRSSMWSRLNAKNRLIKRCLAVANQSPLAIAFAIRPSTMRSRCDAAAIAPAGFPIARCQRLRGMLGPRLTLVGTQMRNRLDDGAVEPLPGVIDLSAQPFAKASQPSGLAARSSDRLVSASRERGPARGRLRGPSLRWDLPDRRCTADAKVFSLLSKASICCIIIFMVLQPNWRRQFPGVPDTRIGSL